MDKKKILLFGSRGMAGHVLYDYLKTTNNYEVTDVAYRTKLTEDTLIVDVNNKEEVRKIIIKSRPECIINGVGVLIKGSKEHPDNAIYINACFPHLLKKYADEVGAKLIHISTDCVFSGKKGDYTEDDFADADDIYGRSKALGEIINDKDLTIRTSIIGPELKQEGEGLFHWFMNQTGEINGYTRAIWGGVTTLELAKAIHVAIQQERTGLIHLSNGQGISKYKLLCLLKEIWGRQDIRISPCDTNETNKSIALSHRFDYIVPDYGDMLMEQYLWTREHANRYSSYLQKCVR
jgi:dTDP-4-dehydrorhamnose reductase